jgi:type I restriction enzyme S subunit
MMHPTHKLGDICQIFTGGTPPRTKREYFGGGIPWVKITDMLQGVVVATAETLTEVGISNSSAKLLPSGTVLISIFATIGRTAVLDIEAATNQAIAGVVPKNTDQLEPRYLRYFLDSKHGELNRAARGVAQPNINQSILKALDVPLPPLPEQRRIVDLLSRAEGIVRLRREAEKKAAELIPALFLDMFGDPATNPKGWAAATLGDLIVDGPQNGLYKHSSHYGVGTPILRIDAFYDGQVRDMKALKRVKLTPEELTRFQLRPRDLVINRVNSPEYLGKSTIIPPLDEATVFESNMMRFAVDGSRVLPEYVIELLQTAYTRGHFLSNAKHAINQSSINQEDVKSLRVPIPSLSKQQDFVGKVEQVRSIQSQQSPATAKAQATLDALLAQTFMASR